MPSRTRRWSKAWRERTRKSGGKWRFFELVKRHFKMRLCDVEQSRKWFTTELALQPKRHLAEERHIGPYACVRNPTATTAKCFEPLHLEHSDHRRPRHYGLPGARSHGRTDCRSVRGLNDKFVPLSVCPPPWGWDTGTPGQPGKRADVTGQNTGSLHHANADRHRPAPCRSHPSPPSLGIDEPNRRPRTGAVKS
jgi:hypothetical protein